MSAESQLFAGLSAHAALASLVGQRIYPDAMPEGGAYPAVVFSRTTTEPIVTIGGAMMGEFATLTVGCWAKSRTDADAAAQEVLAALEAMGEVPLARIASFDPDTGLYATIIDVRLLA